MARFSSIKQTFRRWNEHFFVVFSLNIVSFFSFLLRSILPWLLLRISFSSSVCVSVTSDLFTVCWFLGKKVVHDAKQSFVCGAKKTVSGLCFRLLLFFTFCIHGGNGIAYESSNKPRFKTVRNGRAHAEWVMITQIKRTKLIWGTAITGKGQSKQSRWGWRTERRSIDMWNKVLLNGVSLEGFYWKTKDSYQKQVPQIKLK